MAPASSPGLLRLLPPQPQRLVEPNVVGVLKVLLAYLRNVLVGGLGLVKLVVVLVVP